MLFSPTVKLPNYSRILHHVIMSEIFSRNNIKLKIMCSTHIDLNNLAFR